MSPPHFAASRPLQSLPMSQARVQRPRAPGAGPWVPARRRCASAGAHSSGFSGSLAPGDGNTAGRQGASRNRPWRTKERHLRPRCLQEGEEVSERS